MSEFTELSPTIFSTKEVLVEHIIREASDGGVVAVRPPMSEEAMALLVAKAPHLIIRRYSDRDYVVVPAALASGK